MNKSEVERKLAIVETQIADARAQISVLDAQARVLEDERAILRELLETWSSSEIASALLNEDEEGEADTEPGIPLAKKKSSGKIPAVRLSPKKDE